MLRMLGGRSNTFRFANIDIRLHSSDSLARRQIQGAQVSVRSGMRSEPESVGDAPVSQPIIIPLIARARATGLFRSDDTSISYVERHGINALALRL